MSKIEKLIIRFRSVPFDFTWDELVNILIHYGYLELKSGKTGGSRRRFVDPYGHIIHLHKPHPGSVVKKYVIRYVIEVLDNKN